MLNHAHPTCNHGNRRPEPGPTSVMAMTTAQSVATFSNSAITSVYCRHAKAGPNRAGRLACCYCWWDCVAGAVPARAGLPREAVERLAEARKLQSITGAGKEGDCGVPK